MSDYAIEENGDRITLRLGGDNFMRIFFLLMAIFGAWITLGSALGRHETLLFAMLFTLGSGAGGVVSLLHHGRRVTTDRTLQTLTIETVWQFGTTGTTIIPWRAIRAVQVNRSPYREGVDGWEVAIRTDAGPVSISRDVNREPVSELAEIIARMVDLPFLSTSPRSPSRRSTGS